MSDLIGMIDDTTERLLRKIDDWDVPKSDKEYVTIEKEQWEKLNWYAGNGVEENQELKMENAQLKELLRRCRKKYLSEQETPYSLIKKIDKVLGEE